MKNFEKYEKEIKEIVNQNKPIAVVNNKPCVCEGKCTGCKFDKSKGDMRGCIVKAFEWLYEEYKEPIKLSRLEFELLKCLKGEKLEIQRKYLEEGNKEKNLLKRVEEDIEWYEERHHIKKKEERTND